MSTTQNGRRGLRPHGFALVVVLLLLAVLVAASAALLSTTGRGVFFASRFHEDAAARQAAEAGLAHAMATLETDPDFSGTIDEELTHSASRYRVDFTTSSPGPQDSVNNLRSGAPVATSERPVPPRSALIVSQGLCRGSQVVIRALVGEGERSRTTSILASNRIRLFNKIQVRGIDSFTTNTPRPADLHSNRVETGPAITWQGPNPGDALRSSGRLSASSPDPDCVSLIPTAGASVQGIEFDQPRKDHFNYDISEIVSLRSASPGPSLPTTGSFVLPPGDHYYAGNQTLQGDLLLQDGARLYVNGDLTINGSISGRGMLAVNGFTSLKGDSQVSAAEGDYIALLSKDGVELTGFEGTSYLDSMMGTDSVVATQWPRMKSAMATLANLVEQPEALWVGEFSMGSPFDGPRMAIGNPNEAAHQLFDRMPTGATGEFLKRKFHHMRLFYHDAWHHIDGPPVINFPPDTTEKHTHVRLVTQSYLAGSLQPDQGGIADAVTSQNSLEPDMVPTLQRVRSAVNLENVDKLGTSFFKGYIYTNGPFFVDNEVTIVGAIEAQGLNSVSDRSFGSVTLEPGDVYLGPRSDLWYVDDLFRNDGDLNRSGTLKILLVYESNP